MRQHSNYTPRLRNHQIRSQPLYQPWQPKITWPPAHLREAHSVGIELRPRRQSRDIIEINKTKNKVETSGVIRLAEIQGDRNSKASVLNPKFVHPTASKVLQLIELATLRSCSEYLRTIYNKPK